MKYIRVRWIHDSRHLPVWLISELDDHHWEVRKIEIWQDGTKGFADRTSSYGGTGLGEVPVPSFRELAELPQFQFEEISRPAFEAEWDAREA